jgi:hypothetical protein
MQKGIWNFILNIFWLVEVQKSRDETLGIYFEIFSLDLIISA